MNLSLIFDLAQVNGSVHLTQDLSLLPFEDVSLKGLLKGYVKCSGYFKRVNVALEPLEQHKEGEGTFCAVPTYTFLKPGSNRVEVMLKNIKARSITIKQRIKVAVIEAANAVPKMLAAKEIGGGMEAVSKSAEGGINTKNPSAHSEPEGKLKAEVDQTPLSAEQIEVLLTKISFGEGTKGWTDEQLENARALLVKYSFLFAMDSMDLGKTDLVKHYIELTNYTPIKDRYG